jgi:hypothetical protein
MMHGLAREERLFFCGAGITQGIRILVPDEVVLRLLLALGSIPAQDVSHREGRLCP